jgi:hypothetical protein
VHGTCVVFLTDVSEVCVKAWGLNLEDPRPVCDNSPSRLKPDNPEQKMHASMANTGTELSRIFEPVMVYGLNYCFVFVIPICQVCNNTRTSLNCLLEEEQPVQTRDAWSR